MVCAAVFLRRCGIFISSTIRVNLSESRRVHFRRAPLSLAQHLSVVVLLSSLFRTRAVINLVHCAYNMTRRRPPPLSRSNKATFALEHVDGFLGEGHRKYISHTHAHKHTRTPKHTMHTHTHVPTRESTPEDATVASANYYICS